MAKITDNWRSGGTGVGAYILQPATTGQIPLSLDLLAGQTAVGFRVRNSAGDTLFSIDPFGNLTIAGSISAVINETITGNISATGNLSVIGTSTLTGAVSVASTLTVTGSSTFGTAIGGDGLFRHNLTVNNALSVSGESILSGRVVLGGNLFLPNNGVINFNSGDVTITHSTNTLTFAGATSGYSFDDDLHVVDDAYYTFGNVLGTPDAAIGWNTTQTVDALFLGLSAAQNVFIIAERADAGFDFLHDAQVNPTLFIHSAAANPDQWISFSHDGNDGIIRTSVGGAGTGIVFNTNVWKTADNAGALTFNLPVVTADLIAHNFFFQIDGNNFLTASSVGDGLGGIGPISFTMQANTFTTTADFNATTILPIFASANFIHAGLQISPQQNGTNTQTLIGARAAMIKETAATTLATMIGYLVATPAITGTVTTNIGIDIADESPTGSTTAFGIRVQSQTANATTTRAIEIVGTGVNNGIRLGASPNIYSSAAQIIRFSDSTDARNIVFTLTAAGTQTIGTSAGNLVLSPTSANVVTAANVDMDMSAGGRLFGSGIQGNQQALAANTNLTLDENDSVVTVTTGAVSVNTITLPAASGNEGMIVSVYLITDGGQNANVVRAGADVIQNGSADLSNTQVALDDAGDFVMLQCVSSTVWQILVNSGGTVT